MLYICATPIGNMEDITLRVLRILKTVDLILAEDTRHTRELLTHYEISQTLESLHKFNEHGKSDQIIDLLRQGKDIALVSDAGTPGLSDPGGELIAKVITEDLPLTVLPGANACVTAVVQSGFLINSFHFYGFLPRKKGQIASALQELVHLSSPLVFYESPHRIVATLNALKEHLGDRQCSISREMTKKFEETKRGSLTELIDYFIEHKPRGEFVIVLAGNEQKDSARSVNEEIIRASLLDQIQQGYSKREAVAITAKVFGVGKNEVYRQAIALNEKEN